MPDNYTIEKRKLVRFLVTMPLKYAKLAIKSLGGTVCTHDISAQGVGLITAEELPVNSPLNICLKVPDNGEEIQLEGEVVWSRQVDASKYRCGLKLKGLQIKPIPLVLRTIYSRL
ncbi:MAG: PilZ domain-containing protein [Candidatus Omnitrophica bacterium]|nr:PilZ domain-containing protein [Candidatus Omnitrophota bacterium]MDD5027223.1 PilZ domain-containing protein [Candidatus Omnitrophota bacterium]MDD5661625.1 PilZ domain-containing protein [Candidatus Omnitrophota bacterium]